MTQTVDTPGLFERTAVGIARDVNAGKTSALETAKAYADRTEQYAARLNTHVFFDRRDVERQAATVDARRARGEDMPLAGVPVLIKDNICVEGMPTTCGSKILQGYKPPYHAHVVERLIAAGALIFGKANCDEFAMGSSNENSAFGPVKNPWDLTRVPGGSSGGSAAAVAADLVPVALGSDTGGSIRQPASFCGIVGLKPTYGRVSRFGLVAYGSSLDQIGPLTRTVDDAALVYDVIAGHDARDSTSADRGAAASQAGLREARGQRLAGVRIGLIEELLGDGLVASTRDAVSQAAEVFRELGAEIQRVRIPRLPASIATYYLIATAEASSNLARFDGVRYGHRTAKADVSLREMYLLTRSEGFGREVKQRIMLGTFALAAGYYDAYYAKALSVRALIRRDVETAFTQVDLLLGPTAPTTAYRLGEKSHDPLAMYLGDIGTLTANLAGIPAASIPCGRDAQGLPIGLQLMAPHFAEDALLKGAFLYEQAAGHGVRRPPGF
jgi:aspartyl-tRNA(Asn)/glutamyl-tRNA(Gln) amidotransferase subunit A